MVLCASYGCNTDSKVHRISKFGFPKKESDKSRRQEIKVRPRNLRPINMQNYVQNISMKIRFGDQNSLQKK